MVLQHVLDDVASRPASKQQLAVLVADILEESREKRRETLKAEREKQEQNAKLVAFLVPVSALALKNGAVGRILK